MNRSTSTRQAAVARRLAALVLVALAVQSCGQQEPSQPPSLDSPSAIAVAERSDCGSANPALERFGRPGTECALGLVANADSNRLAFADLSRRRPAMFDLDRSVPSVTHVPVGRHPVDVAATNDGTVAYTLNSAGGTLSVVDLWRLRTLEQSVELPGTPSALAVRPGAESSPVVAALADPNRLWIRESRSCLEAPEDGTACPEVDASATHLPLPGTPADIDFTPDGRLAIVTYEDLAYASAVAFPPTGDELRRRDLECRGPRTSAPCEVERIGLVAGCRDGIDNDGDGLADQRDPQCFGPRGAESPDGVGRATRGPCSDGIDNDDDGLVDRRDPDCLYPGGEESSLPVESTPVTACNNGQDDDGDGEVDAEEDGGCYGRYGEREDAPDPRGFGDVDIDDTGNFGYVVDRANSQILTLDLRHLEMIDAGRAVEPPTAAFGGGFGVSVGSRPRAVGASVSRRVTWRDPDDGGHGIVRYNFGAYAASDNGRAYFVNTVSVQCEVDETNRSNLLDPNAFRRRDSSYRHSAERDCVTLPQWPIERDRTSEACTAVDACRTCLDEASGETPPVEACRSECENIRERRHACRAEGRMYRPSERTQVAVNPQFSLRDTQSRSARLRDAGECNDPDAYTELLQSYVSDNPDGPQATGCTSRLRPQPVSRSVDPEEAGDSFEETPRADLLERTRVGLAATETGAVERTVQSRPWDFRARDEVWTVTWEGVIPDTDRSDGLFGQEEPGVLDTGLDLCRAGVEAGDRLVVRSKPAAEGETPDRCSGLRASGGRDLPEDVASDDTYRTYRIADVDPRSLTLETISSEVDGQFSQTLPTRDCFRSTVEFEIRPEDEWTVVGSQSGYTSSRRSAHGTCLPRAGASQRRLASRVESGGIYTGPYLEFELHPGAVPPIRRSDDAFQFQFATQRFFDADRFRTNTKLPSAVRLVTDVPGGAKLLLSDASDDFVYVKNLSFPADDPVQLR